MSEIEHEVFTSKKSKRWLWITAIIVVLLVCGGAVAIVKLHANAVNNAPKALMQKALLAEKSDNYTSAIGYYNRVIANNPNNAGNYTTYAYYNLGVINTTEGNTTVAQGDYSSALQSDPIYLPARFNLAVSETASNPVAALSDYARILAISPHDADTLFNAGLLNEQLGNKKLAKAMVKEAIKYNPALASRVPVGFPPLK